MVDPDLEMKMEKNMTGVIVTFDRVEGTNDKEMVAFWHTPRLPKLNKRPARQPRLSGGANPASMPSITEVYSFATLGSLGNSITLSSSR